ncbi:hypothetical protein [Acinetobacter johnsonii]|uniref:hypothetical protein n=1 Tax=Acinetobacter johnsonii TaxID=40214 RepID=UPI001F3D7FC0|nr:hypothetical protein [Acinetobacter johnsonii]
MKRLADFTVTMPTPRPAVKVLLIEFGTDEATHRIMIHHARRVIRQHIEEIQKLAYKIV